MTTSEKSLSGKTVLVTGAGGGLGKAIAAKFVAAGANVVICDVHGERLKEASTELSAKGIVKVVVADITSEESIQNLFSEITKEFNRLDILVNNAGIMDRFDPVGDLDRALWDKVIAVNLTAPYLLSKEAVRIMLAQPEPKGSILNISSVSGKAGGVAGAAYTASKHGLDGLTKNTAAFYGKKGIRCNALMVGGMTTNITDAMRNGINTEGFQMNERLLGGVGMQLLDVDDVADLALYVSSAESAKIINGAIIAADNGWTGTTG